MLDVIDSHLKSLNNLAWLLRDSEPAEAPRYAEQPGELAPDSFGILDTLAIVQLKNEAYADATRNIKSAKSIQPEALGFKFHQAQIKAGTGDTADIRRILTAVLEDDPELAQRAEAEAFYRSLQ